MVGTGEVAVYVRVVRECMAVPSVSEPVVVVGVVWGEGRGLSVCCVIHSHATA